MIGFSMNGMTRGYLYFSFTDPTRPRGRILKYRLKITNTDIGICRKVKIFINILILLISLYYFLKIKYLLRIQFSFYILYILLGSLLNDSKIFLYVSSLIFKSCFLFKIYKFSSSLIPKFLYYFIIICFYFSISHQNYYNYYNYYN